MTSSFWTFPNILTCGRLALAPLICVSLICSPPRFDMALVCFIIAGMSDFLDGFLARMLHQESTWGAWLDPLADKILVTLVFGALVWNGALPWVLFAAAALRDGLITGGVVWLKKTHKPLTIQPLFISKLNTALQMMMVIIVLVLGAWGVETKNINDFWGVQCLVAVTLLTTFFSGVAYTYVGWKLCQISESVSN